MKFRLKAGEWIDTLTKPELDEAFRDHEERQFAWQRVQQREPRWVRPDASAETDANGNVILDVYRVGNGQEYRLARAVLEVDGYSAGAPFSGGGFHVLRDGLLVSPVPGPLPTSTPYPEGGQPRFRNGDLIQVQVFGGPPNTQVTAHLEGSLYIGAA